MIKSKMIDAWDSVSARFYFPEEGILPLAILSSLIILFILEMTGAI